MKKRDIRALSILSVIVLLDRLVKIWCVNVLKNVETIPIIQDVLHFTYAENRGAAFSILEGKRFFLVLVSLFALGLMVYAYQMKEFRHPLMGIAFPVVAGGALGNLIDRMLYGYVVDFIDVRMINFAVFNIADMAINVGGFLLLFYILFLMKGEDKKLQIEAKEKQEEA